MMTKLVFSFIITLFSIALVIPFQALAFETKAKQAIILDHAGSIVLFAKDAEKIMYPASMTKMMTAYIVFEELKRGKLSLEDQFPVSENAWRKGGSKMFVELGNNIPIGDLLRGVIVQSGNDACIVIAEGLAGSEEEFAKRMTETAKRLGMHKTQFKNATGWPDEQHYTTAKDLAILAHRLVKDFPEYYPIFAEKDFTYHNILQHNRNVLLNRNLGVDGLKTGHTEASGYGITVSALDGDRRVIVVVNGLDSERARAEEAQRLVQYALNGFEIVRPTGEEAGLKEIPIWYGAEESVPVRLSDEHSIILPKVDREQITYHLKYNSPLQAPIKAGDQVAELVVAVPNMEAQALPVLAQEDVEKAGFLRRIFLNIKQLFE